MRSIIVTLALVLLPTWASAEPFTGKLAQLPPIVQEHIREMERGCIEVGAGRPDYRLSKVVQVHPLSGARTRDYIVDEGQFGCHSEGFTSSSGLCGSGGCGFAVFVQRGRDWVCGTRTGPPCNDLAADWYTIRRPGKRTVMVIKRRCYGDKAEPCYGRYCYSSILRVTRVSMKEVALRPQKREGC
jgi:hypothetical protein